MAGPRTEQLIFRAPRPDEAEAAAAVVNGEGRATWGTDQTTREEILAGWTAPGVDRERDAVVAVDSDGELVGYGAFHDAGRRHEQFWLFVSTHPRNLSLLGALVGRLEDRARELAVPGAVARASAPSVDPARASLLTDELGYRLVRHFFRMEIELPEKVEDAAWPNGVEVRSFRRGQDEHRVFEADQESFADHWAFVPDRFDEWEHWMLKEPFDPSVWFLAVDGEEVAGICLCPPHKEGEPELAWVDVLAVRRAWRRRGIALALLRHAFAEFRRRGFRRAGLGVDGENTTGAVRLYERAGMAVARRWDSFEKPLG